jgi:hypothetical protein
MQKNLAEKYLTNRTRFIILLITVARVRDIMERRKGEVMRDRNVHVLSAVLVIALIIFGVPLRGNGEETGLKSKEAEVSQEAPKKEAPKKERGASHKTHKSRWTDIKKSAKKIEPNIPEKYKDLAKAVDEYWNALKAKDYAKAYAMENEAYRKKVSLDLYKERHKKAVEIIAVRPLEVRPLKEEKEVMVKSSFRYKAGPIDSVRFIEESWVKEGEDWRHIL